VFEGNTPQTFSGSFEGFPIDYFGRSFFAFKDYEGNVRLGFFEFLDSYSSWVSEPWHPPTAENPLIMYSRYWRQSLSQYPFDFNLSQCGQISLLAGDTVLYEDNPVALSDILDAESSVASVVAFATPDDFQWENKINTFEVLV
jgi:hypothetical protein